MYAGRRKWTFFARGMDINQIGAEGNAVEPGELTCKQAAFQSRVNGFDLRFLAGLLGIDCGKLVAQRGLAPVFPCGIRARHMKRPAQQLRQRVDADKQHLLLRRNGTSDRTDRCQNPILHMENTEVAGRLHQSRNVHAHSCDAVRHEQPGSE